METNDWLLAVLGTGLGIAVVTDLKTHRVPNWLTLNMAMAGLVLQFSFGQWHGLLLAMGGMMVGLLCFLPLHLFGAMGAGDVKLLAAIGTLLGPWTVFVAALLTIVAGGVIAMVNIGIRGGLGAMFRRYGCMVLLLKQGQLQYLPPAADEAAGLRFPYALAIAFGTVISVWFVTAQSEMSV